jgi:hypothetical protein
VPGRNEGDARYATRTRKTTAKREEQDMNDIGIPLSFYEVDCDGSACGFDGAVRHIHPPQHGYRALGRVIVRDGERIGYAEAEGITRLVIVT